jgi:hypothetical protein
MPYTNTHVWVQNGSFPFVNNPNVSIILLQLIGCHDLIVIISIRQYIDHFRPTYVIA